MHSSVVENEFVVKCPSDHLSSVVDSRQNFELLFLISHIIEVTCTWRMKCKMVDLSHCMAISAVHYIVC